MTLPFITQLPMVHVVHYTYRIKQGIKSRLEPNNVMLNGGSEDRDQIKMQIYKSEWELE